jgi:predicted HD phosphohydrolase
VIVGLLFHDVGQVANQEHVGNVEVLHPNHAEFGEQWLKSRRFPSFVTDWVRDHALAKVVLCDEDPDYYQHLSSASQDSYLYQKEKYDMPENRCRYENFMNHPRKNDFLAARKCDDMAKIIDFIPPNFEEYRAVVQRVMDGQGAPATDPNWRRTIDAMYCEMVDDRERFEEHMRASYAVPLRGF